jgi:hypothetical protein
MRSVALVVLQTMAGSLLNVQQLSRLIEREVEPVERKRQSRLNVLRRVMSFVRSNNDRQVESGRARMRLIDWVIDGTSLAWDHSSPSVVNGRTASMSASSSSKGKSSNST